MRRRGARIGLRPVILIEQAYRNAGAKRQCAEQTDRPTARDQNSTFARAHAQPFKNFISPALVTLKR